MLEATSSTPGGTPNQQLIPAAEYLMSKEGGGYKKFYLLGTDYVFPRTANKILRAFLLAKGVPADNIAEEYTPFNHQDYQTIVGKIKRFCRRRQGLPCSRPSTATATCPSTRSSPTRACAPRDAPIMAFSVAEDELRGMDTSALVGHLAAWNYYQSRRHAAEQEVRPELQGLLQEEQPARRRQARHRRSDGGRLLRRLHLEAGRREGQVVRGDAVRKAVYGQKFLAPGGKIKMDEANQHTYKPVLIGEILKDGQFKVVSRSKGL